MKAYKVFDAKCDECGSTIVFAENIKEAKKIARSTEVCEDSEYIDIRVKRYKSADYIYKGKDEIDWYDDDTRLELVKEFGWSCLEECFRECEKCVAREYCYKAN